MNPNVKKLFTNLRIIILVIALIIALVAINPNPGVKGVAIRAVVPNSSADNAGIVPPKALVLPRNREIITAVNNKPVTSLEDYEEIIGGLLPNKTVTVKTSKQLYTLRTPERYVDLGLSVYDAPTTNIRKGLDLQGGTRVVLQPEKKLDDYEMQTLIDTLSERLNVYGLSDMTVREAGDFLSGNQYVVVEIAGATQDEIRELLGKQGKFEAKIANKTVFLGGNDITFVCRTSDCSGIDPYQGCSKTDGGWGCSFRFDISLANDAAQRFADATKDSALEPDGKHLVDKIEFYLDDTKVDELGIAADLKGKQATQVTISGYGVGQNEQAAAYNALQVNMKRMQTILISGSLPVKLTIAKSDAISPLLGKGFVRNSFFVALLAMAAVSIIMIIRYKKLLIAIPIIITMVSEVLLMLGIAAFIGSNIDMAAIAGILAAIASGVDDQIVITDETLKRKEEEIGSHDWKQKIKRAFMIVLMAYVTVVVAMIPLLFAGAGLLKGFAITTIIGVTAGVLITRPAYGVFVELFLKE